MTSRTRSGTHALTVCVLVVAAVGALASGLFARELILHFLTEPTGQDYRAAVLCMATVAVALVVLALVTRLGRGAPWWVTAFAVALALVAAAVTAHDASMAGSVADQGDPAALDGGVWILLLLVPTSWPLVVTVVVRPIAVLVSHDWTGRLRGPSYPAPR